MPGPTIRQHPGFAEVYNWARKTRRRHQSRRYRPRCAVPGCRLPGSKAKGLCPRHYRRWRADQEPEADLNLIQPDDGIVDYIAVELAVKGTRVVRMTQTERRVAADKILAAGGDVVTVSERLGIPYEAARWLVRRLTVIDLEL